MLTDRIQRKTLVLLGHDVLRFPKDYTGRMTSMELKRRTDKPGVVVHTCNPITEDNEAGRLGVRGHPQLHIKHKPSLGITRCIFLAIKILRVLYHLGNCVSLALVRLVFF